MHKYISKKPGLWMLACLAAFPVLAVGQEFYQSPTFAGHAVALQVTQSDADTVALAESGLAPAKGGQRQNFMRDTPPMPGVSAHLLYALTVGNGSQDHSQAALASLDVTLGSHHVSALWVESAATANAEFLNVSTSGKSSVAGLIVDGQPVAVTGEANQTITLQDGFLVINEQAGFSNPHFGTLTVNALRLLVDGVGSFTAASSTAEIINAPTRNTGLEREFSMPQNDVVNGGPIWQPHWRCTRIATPCPAVTLSKQRSLPLL
jgi:hypothetical protein